MWPFSHERNKDKYREVSAIATEAVTEQISRVRRTLGPNLSKNLNLLQNVNGVVSGYALGIASAELSEKGQMSRGDERPLADAIQSAFKMHGQDIHIWEHHKSQSFGFTLGVIAGGQETTNKHQNLSIWKQCGSRYNLLHEILSVAGNSFDFAAVNVRKALYEHGVRVDDQLVTNAMDQMTGRS